MYPPPPHPPRALNLPGPPPPPGTASDYPIRRYSASATEEHGQPSTNRLSLPSNLPGCAESPSQPPPLLPTLPVDRRFTCLQNLHTPPVSYFTLQWLKFVEIKYHFIIFF